MKKLFFILFILIVANSVSNACTVAVISGKYTKDGRPLLWKNRDTWALNNKIMYFNDSTYKYMGLVNSQDYSGKSIWIGMNEKGFAIMNSNSYNLTLGDTAKHSGLEGRLMKYALANFATVEEFQQYLDNMEKPTGLEGNFGVIDGQGGAALFELGFRGYEKFDANDPKVAPFGYVLRGNYSFTGSYGDESSGYIRYHTVDDLFYQASATNNLDAQFVIQDVTRGLKHSLLKTDLYEQYRNIPENTPTYTFFHDFIPRKSTASACVVQGVMNGENPEFVTLWSVVGFPLTSIVVPTWLKAEDDFPEVIKMNEELDDSPLCNAALSLKEEVFTIRWGKFASLYYININALVNADKTGIRQKIKPDEDIIFSKTNEKLEDWYNNGMDKTDVIEFNKWLNNFIQKSYKKNFNIDL
ncbi:MAG: hypothetical protein ABFS16_06080 [Bacteroidota bacterium]